ncbi:MAG: deoxyribose-phosphate aldolase [Ilumatobacteraceae bacterium]
MNPPSDPAPLTRAELAALVDHTVLRPEATRAEVEAVAVEAVELGCASVCVQPSMVAFVADLLGGRLPVCTVVGFPHGTQPARVTADAAAAAVALGATEIDMVLDLGAVAESEFDVVRMDVAEVRAAVPRTVLKVIVESALWSPPVLREVCEAVVDAGGDYVKTSTGFHPAGGATVEAVATMRATVGRRCGVKASGGIRTAQDARAMVTAGADRLGLSATASVLAGWD